MKNGKKTALLAAALVLVTLAGFAAAAGESGGAGDPLVSLSYLNQIFKPAVLAELDGALAARDNALKNDFSARLDAHIQELNAALAASPGGLVPGTGGERSGTFGVVTLTSGQTLTADAGTEILLRAGAAACAASSAPGLIDMTAGGALDPGYSLEINHLYLVTENGRGAAASADTVTLLVRGAYTIS